MNLKILLKNISDKTCSFRFIGIRNTKQKIIATCLVVALIIVIALGVNISLENRSKNDAIETQLEEYENQLNIYNATVDNYNSLIIGLAERNYVVDQEKVEEKKEFYTDSQKQEAIIIDRETQSIKNEADILIGKYDEKCLEIYNEALSSCNAMIAKYNALIDEIGDYATLMHVEKKQEKPLIDVAVQSWKKSTEYLEGLDILMQEEKQISDDSYMLVLNAENEIIKDFNIVADEYNVIVDNAVVDYVDGLPKKVSIKKELEESALANKTEGQLQDSLDNIKKDKDEIVVDYLILTQITMPSEQWIIQRLKEISYITNEEAVTKENDLNGLLGKEGGYASCIYFSVSEIVQKDIPGDTLTAKGTDAGGAIEVYDSREHALNRCDYLSQFDGTILYSGSYTAVGTMVVRTSYKLNDEQQVRLTDSIIAKFTEVK
ncbi:MAG: hypothetical protein VZR24_13825 [Butyrivibrio hungatei]|nr:hypothetical protein [Butyrivibrio hungatei]